MIKKVLILIKAFITFEPKIENAFSVFNTFGKSRDFSREMFRFLTKVMILVRRCLLF